MLSKPIPTNFQFRPSQLRIPFFDLPEFEFPTTDLKETKDSYHLNADLPGFKKEDLSISCTDNKLTLKGRIEEEDNKDSKTWLKERSFGEFERVFLFDHLIDSEKIKAEFIDGVLRVTVPKSESVVGSEIEIK